MNSAPALHSFKNWIRMSREEQQRAPERYLSYYLHAVMCDEFYAWMTRKTLDEIKQNCGQYDHSFPTGSFCGKLFVQQGYLVWFGIDKVNPQTHIYRNYREIRIIDE